MEIGQLTGILYFQKTNKIFDHLKTLLVTEWARTELRERKGLAVERGRVETETEIGGTAAETGEGTEGGTFDTMLSQLVTSDNILDQDPKIANQKPRGVNLHYTGMFPLQGLNISHQCSTSPCRYSIYLDALLFVKQ